MTTLTESGDAPGGRIQALFAQMFLLSFVLILFAGIIEVGARVYLMHFASEGEFLTYASERQLVAKFGAGNSKFVQHLYLWVIPRPNWTRGPNHHNSLGFRGEEFPV